MTTNPTALTQENLPSPCRVSIIIKALNEERGIEASIESALRAVSAVRGG